MSDVSFSSDLAPQTLLVGQLHQPERTKGHIHGEGYGRHQPVYGQNPVSLGLDSK